nr:cytochrome bd oxidase small subunit, CydX/CbdX family [Burkholderia pseudomallei]
MGVALAFGIINAMWLEARQKRDAYARRAERRASCRA